MLKWKIIFGLILTFCLTFAIKGAAGNTLKLNRGGGNENNCDFVNKGATTVPSTKLSSEPPTKVSSLPPTELTSEPPSKLTTVIPTTEATFTCPPGTENGAKLANPKYKTQGCDSYYECGSDGKGKLTKCPEGQAFMSVGQSLKCANKSSVDECPNFYQGCPAKLESNLTADLIQLQSYQPDLVNRSRFYFCDNGSPFHLSCPIFPDPAYVTIYAFSGICYPFNKTLPTTPCPAGTKTGSPFPDPNYQQHGCKYSNFCLYGIGYLSPCPPGSLFQNVGIKNDCVPAFKLDNCATGLFKDCPVTNDTKATYKADPTDPTRYYSCEGGSPFRLKCAAGVKFDSANPEKCTGLV